MTSRRRQCGFSLIELLVVIAIVGVLAAIILPAVQYARESARRVQCSSRLRNIIFAIHSYHDMNKTFPPGWISVDEAAGKQDPAKGTNGASWAVMLLPQLDEMNLFNEFDSDVQVSHPNNDVLRNAYLKIFRCPSDAVGGRWIIPDDGSSLSAPLDLPTASYVGVFGHEPLDGCTNGSLQTPNGRCNGSGVFYHNSRIRFADIDDGETYTLAIGEREAVGDERAATWLGVVPGGVRPYQRVVGTADLGLDDPNRTTVHFSPIHAGNVVLFAFCDGTVKPINAEIDDEVFKNLATRARGETDVNY